MVKKQNKPVSQVCHRFAALPQVLRTCLMVAAAAGPLEGAFGNRGRRAAPGRSRPPGGAVVGTEPVIRVMGEGDDKALVEEVVDGIVDALTDIAA